MNSIMVLIINGIYFFFEDGTLTEKDKENLKMLARNIRTNSEEFINYNEEEICNIYIKKAAELFNIQLRKLNITDVLRISK